LHPCRTQVHGALQGVPCGSGAGLDASYISILIELSWQGKVNGI